MLMEVTLLNNIVKFQQIEVVGEDTDRTIDAVNLEASPDHVKSLLFDMARRIATTLRQRAQTQVQNLDALRKA